MEKAGEGLREWLEKATSGDEATVIFVLKFGEERVKEGDQALFVNETPRERRIRLIARRQEMVQKQLDAVWKRLERYGLKVKKGTLGPVVVAVGGRRMVIEALLDEDVVNGELDSPLG